MRMNEVPPIRDIHMRDEEDKKDDGVRFDKNNGFGGSLRNLQMMQGQREMEILESYRQQEEYEKCIVCKKSLTKEDEARENKLILWSTDCFHMTHKKCFMAHLM